jgi:hypothetical protein
LPDVPGAPQGLVLRRIRDTAIEFCRETQIWEYELDEIRMKEGVLEYEIEGDQPSCTDIDAIRFIERFQDRDALRERRPEFVMQPFVDYTVPNKWIIRLRREPTLSMDGRLMLPRVALRPTLDTDELDDRVFTDWYEGLAHGAKYKLMSIPGKEYTDPEAAIFHEREYQRAISKARIELNRGRMNSNIQASTMRRFTLGGGSATTNVRHPDRFFIT